MITRRDFLQLTGLGLTTVFVASTGLEIDDPVLVVPPGSHLIKPGIYIIDRPIIVPPGSSLAFQSSKLRFVENGSVTRKGGVLSIEKCFIALDENFKGEYAILFE